MSHTKSCSVLALSDNAPVGVDLELRRARRLGGLVNSCLSNREIGEFALLPSHKKLNHFYRIWTAKEAVLKAVGVGLAGRMKLVEPRTVSSNTDSTTMACEYSGADWSILTANVAEYAVAFATAEHQPLPRFHIELATADALVLGNEDARL